MTTNGLSASYWNHSDSHAIDLAMTSNKIRRARKMKWQDGLAATRLEMHAERCFMGFGNMGSIQNSRLFLPYFRTRYLSMFSFLPFRLPHFIIGRKKERKKGRTFETFLYARSVYVYLWRDIIPLFARLLIYFIKTIVVLTNIHCPKNNFQGSA